MCERRLVLTNEIKMTPNIAKTRTAATGIERAGATIINAGETASEGVDGPLVPMALVAVTVKV